MQLLRPQLCADFSAAEVIFATIGGLRGAISLILAQMVVTEQGPEHKKGQRITAEVCQAGPKAVPLPEGLQTLARLTCSGAACRSSRTPCIYALQS